MSITARVSVHSNVEQPSGRMAVMVPDIFPSAAQHDDLSGVHDIVKGHVPHMAAEDEKEGWLRLAMQTGDRPAYVDPGMPLQQQLEIYEGYRRTVTGKLVVDEVREIPRSMIRLDDLTAKARVGEDRVYLPRPDRNLSQAWPIESALAFTGKIAVKGEERRVFGMHIQSTREHGWARLLDPGTGDESAKIQQEPPVNDTFERIIGAK